MPAQLGQLKTGQDGKGLLRIHLWCPDDLPRLWDRIPHGVYGGEGEGGGGGGGGLHPGVLFLDSVN